MSSPVLSPASQCSASTDSEDLSLDDNQISFSTKDVRVQPIEMSMKPRKDESVRVAVRIRPMLPRELAHNAATCVHKSKEAANTIVLNDGSERIYTFDYVFPQSANQLELYNEALDPWMASFLQGFNVTVIAYGQTGSGKTHTMGNHVHSMMSNNVLLSSLSFTDDHEELADNLDDDEGLIPRFLYQLFSKLKDHDSKYQLSVSFLEIYGEDIYDLLDSSRADRRSESLQLRESKKNGVWVQGLTEVCISTRREALQQMRRGSMQRITATTQMNERSSRSHAVYTVKLVQRVSEQKAVGKSSKSSDQQKGKSVKCTIVDMRDGEAAEQEAVIVSKLTFVDLAGSERLKKTRAEGERMKEGIQINVGLFALGNVINALGDDKRLSASHVHVPYRSSKLTRLLQDALGGNSRTLFIACVSPADYNTNETLNTLQYANRAKNIQNKAVKNIDKRSTEIVNLKAFNHILCREFVKTILSENGVTDVDARTEGCMTSSKVLAYLDKIAEIAASANVEASNDECLVIIQRLLRHLMTYLHELVPSGNYQHTLTLASSTGAKHDCCQPPDEHMDPIINSGSSIAILEDQMPDLDGAFMVPYPFENLCRILEIINCAFEMQEIKSTGKQQNDRLKAKIKHFEMRYHRQLLLRNGLVSTIERIRTWLAEHALDETPGTQLTITRSLEEAMANLKSVDVEMEELQFQKDELTREQGEQIIRSQIKWKNKQIQIERIRENSEVAATNALDIMTRRTEIKVRFDGYDLDSISDFLKEEEKEIAAFLYEDNATLSLTTPLFSREELSLSHTHEIWSMIQDQLQYANDKETLEASMSKELRKRTQLIQNITTGLKAKDGGEMTEQEFMEKNEQSLKTCEDCICYFRDAMRAKQSQRASMDKILDSIKSLELAKDVIKRLIVENYSQWRMYMVCDEEENMKRKREAEEIAFQSLETAKIAMDKKIENLEAKYLMDVQSARQMVMSFNDAVGSRTDLERFTKVQEFCDISASNESEKISVCQLAEKGEQLAIMREKLDCLQAPAMHVEMKDELNSLMKRCQEIWNELGVNENDQASRFQDMINHLVKKCSKELEGLEAARNKLHARINDTYLVVHQLEAVLQDVDRVDIDSLSSLAGPTLLEQEKYIYSRQKRLSHDFWQRVKAYLHISDGIRGLMADLQIETIDDFSHVSYEDIGWFDAEGFKLAPAELLACRQFQENEDDPDAMTKALESIGDGARISKLAEHRNEVLFEALLTEKTKRIVELQNLSEAIRTVAQSSSLSRRDIISVINALHCADGEHVSEDTNETNEVIDLSAWIFQTGGHLDVSKKTKEILSELLKEFQKIEAGRLAALEFLRRTKEEAAILLRDKRFVDSVDDQMSHFLMEDLQRNENFMDILDAGKKMLVGLKEPVKNVLCSLLSTTNDAFAAFGIDTKEHQASFYLGSKDEGQRARRALLEKYAMHSTSLMPASEDKKEGIEHCNDSLLSNLDPAFGQYCWVCSISYGKIQLQELRDSIADIDEIQCMVKSTQKRIDSLQKIMKIYTKINEFKAKIAEFETSASQKERLFGNSLRLLEEERFRKMAAKHYPNLLASLRKEVTRWLQNEDGEFNLSVLGEDLKKFILEMMNTDTGLMHLDLSTVRRSAKHPLTSSSSTSNLQISSKGSARARTQSAHVLNLET
ncbi:kinesin-like protein [Plasmopara halstedii]|uniref:Kinesin-like protein n=1 Tax=Plasmopara halstedii TaxID=4781 RepID=A0A0P1AF96_PLAHL|nr:kinesin-like protein [Plasmopara halstedii]CEG39786.1 kinesin-like protein [Plasmopara halstedii]|eukprot:XP_024576155.1 kinesin-like protein [Plasmopara halstedii]